MTYWKLLLIQTISMLFLFGGNNATANMCTINHTNTQEAYLYADAVFTASVDKNKVFKVHEIFKDSQGILATDDVLKHDTILDKMEEPISTRWVVFAEKILTDGNGLNSFNCAKLLIHPDDYKAFLKAFPNDFNEDVILGKINRVEYDLFQRRKDQVIRTTIDVQISEILKSKHLPSNSTNIDIFAINCPARILPDQNYYLSLKYAPKRYVNAAGDRLVEDTYIFECKNTLLNRDILENLKLLENSAKL